ncbi:MAG: hypothetical protein R2729_22530 [Bryobacteraceae bacterium]
MQLGKPVEDAILHASMFDAVKVAECWAPGQGSEKPHPTAAEGRLRNGCGVRPDTTDRNRGGARDGHGPHPSGDGHGSWWRFPNVAGGPLEHLGGAVKGPIGGPVGCAHLPGGGGLGDTVAAVRMLRGTFVCFAGNISS